MKPRIALNLSKATFDLKIPIDGTLYLMAYGEEYRFEFKPNNPSEYADEDVDSNRFKIVFRLNDVSEIIRHQDTYTSSLQFVLFDKTLLPHFIFHQNQKAPDHLLEFLLFKKYAVKTDENNRIKIKVSLLTPLKKMRPGSYLDPRHAIDFMHHKKIIHDLMEKNVIEEESLTFDEIECEFNPDGSSYAFKYIKPQIFARGLDNELRIKLYPYLLNVYDISCSLEQNEINFEKKVEEYKNYRRQWESIIKEQNDQILPVRSFLKVIIDDIKRTDRKLPQFKDDKSPYLHLLRNILLTYGMYNRDTRYVQGMSDLAAIFIIVFIKGFKNITEMSNIEDLNSFPILIPDQSDIEVEMANGTTIKIINAEAFIFWMFEGILSLLHHDILFTSVVDNQRFHMDRIMTIISKMHPPLYNWLVKTNNSDLLFMYGSYLLLFKRDFTLENLLRIWDSFFCAKNPAVFPRVFLASVLMQLYPKYLFQTDGSAGEVNAITTKSISSINILDTLNMSSEIYDKIINEDKKFIKWVLIDLPSHSMHQDYQPKYLNFFSTGT